MAIDPDDEILQDFLVEAGEILELLGEQLVDLEHSPSDNDLLNAIFRGFHTIKGGASFVGLTNMVEVCHKAEDVFNLMRQGERTLDAHMMDIFLRVVDVVNDMFDEVRGGNDPSAADPSLVQELAKILSDSYSGDAAAAQTTETSPDPVAAEPLTEPVENTAIQADTNMQETAASAVTAQQSSDITDTEFEKLLDIVDEEKKSSESATTPAATSGADDEITEEEFEQLLDELHGPGKHSASTEVQTSKDSVSNDEITEEEFDQLLDELHGKGNPIGIVESKAAVDSEVVSLVQTETSIIEPAAAVAGSDTVMSTPAQPPTQQPSKPAAATPKPNTPEKGAAPKEGKAKEAPQAETTVRVDTKRLDDIMNMVGELVLVRNRLVTLESVTQNEELAQAIGNLDLVTADLQSAVMKTRMQPIKKVFGRFPRVVRDLARSLKKEVNLVLQGEETDLDKNLVEALADPLVHLVRNAVDHGVEMPDKREQSGKERTGNIILAAEQEGDHILLTIKDDGGGMDPDMLRGKAVEKGLMDADAASRLTDNECFNLIFAPGFSTKEEISDISGRGVGMDVVKTRIVQLNGTIDIDSKVGVGTTLSIKVPLTLAILPTLMVQLENRIFALPLTNVNEIFKLDLTHTNNVDGQLVIMVRDKPLPLFFLHRWLVMGIKGAPRVDEFPKEGHVVVVSIGNQKVGFIVEHLIGQEEVVIKPLGAMLHGTQGLAGATITGDGRIALILDVPSLVRHYAKKV